MLDRTVISSSRAPAAIGPYSQAIRAGGLLFCSGQIPLDPETGEMVGDDAASQTRQVMANLAAVLDAAGATLESVVRCTIFLANMDDFQAVNVVYGMSFPSDPPARETVGVAALPKGALVEISAIAQV